MFKVCTECGGEKPKRGPSGRYYGRYCRVCDRAKKREAYLAARGGILKQPPATIGPKLCSKCKQLKPQESFYINKIGTRNASCRACRSAMHTQMDKARNKETMRIWRINNPDKSKSNHLKSKYGIDSNKYNEIMLEQNGKCAICSDVSRKLCVDHCHNTGAVRGILCHKCNTAIGMLDDDVPRIESAASYLRRFLCTELRDKQQIEKTS